MATRLDVTFARKWGILGVLLSCAAIGAGCDDTGEGGPDDPPMPRGTAVFSRATPGQLEIVLAAPDLALSAAEAALFVASLDHQSSRGQCPQIIPEGDTQVTVIGEGCMLPSGGSYQGTARYTLGQVVLTHPATMPRPSRPCAGFTEALAREVGRYNIRVNVLSPGLLDVGLARILPRHRIAEYLSQCAMERLGTADEIARVAAFLVSDDNSLMTGAKIVADGGL